MKVRLSLKAKDLPNVAGMFKGKSDPYAVVTVISSKGNAQPEVIGRTETIKNSLCPDWSKSFSIDYELGYSIKIVVKILDEVRKGRDIDMGSAVFELGALLGSRGSSKAIRMKKGGTLYARVVQEEGSGSLRLKLSGSQIKFPKKIDPFFQISRNEGGIWNSAYRSHQVKNNVNPVWNEDNIPLSSLCGKNLDTPLRLGVYHYELSGKHSLIAEFETSVNGMIRARNDGFNLINSRGAQVGRINVHTAEVTGEENQMHNYIPASAYGQTPPATAPHHGQTQTIDRTQSVYSQSSTVAPSVAASAPLAPTSSYDSEPLPMPIPMPMPMPPRNVQPQYTPPPTPAPTFINYMNGGCEIQLSVAIDFTGSNGDPRMPGTLHHFGYNGVKNDYEKCFSSIGRVLANYDSDQMFPVWGFGAKFNGQLYHLFQCGQTPEVHGVQGIINAYRGIFQSGLVMSGPTVLTQVIDAAAAFARKGQEDAQRAGSMKYSILLVLTDGSVSDVNATLQSLHRASDAPLSIVVVGIGQADFSAMKHLDDQRNFRDILQFVEFNAHRNNPHSLTEATLNEIPDQLVSYFRSRGVMPKAAVAVSDQEIVVESQSQEPDINFQQNANGQYYVPSGGYVPQSAYNQTW